MTSYHFKLTLNGFKSLFINLLSQIVYKLTNCKVSYSSLALILCLFFFSLPHLSQAQYTHQFELSKSMNESKMGYWTKGNYTIYIDLIELESNFRTSSKEYNEAALNYKFVDSNSIILYKKTARKYLEAADIISNVSNGFDLRKVRFDTDSAEYSNLYTLPKLENLLLQKFTQGKAALYYKGQRIYTCKFQTESYGKEILDHGMTTTYYCDTISDYVFKESRHLGW